MPQVAKRTPSVKEEDEQLLDQLWLDSNTLGAHEEADVVTEKEKIVRAVKCSLVTLMDCNPGRLEVTTKHLYFFSDQQERKETQACECWWGREGEREKEGGRECFHVLSTKGFEQGGKVGFFQVLSTKIGGKGFE